MQDEDKTKSQLIDDLNEMRRKNLLRDAAEDKLGKSPDATHDLKEKTPEEIIHELHVHQFELEMQNEELKRVQLELEGSRNKANTKTFMISLLLDTLLWTHKGLIEEVNLTGAALLGMPRPKLIERGFGHFVSPNSLDLWDKHIISVLGHEEKQTCDLRLLREDESSFYARSTVSE